MPFSDSQKTREYMRDYMRRRRAGAVKPVKPEPAGALQDEINGLKITIGLLRGALERQGVPGSYIDSAYGPMPALEPRAAVKPDVKPRLVEELQARIAELEQENARLREEPKTGPSRDADAARIAELEAEVTRLRQESAENYSRFVWAVNAHDGIWTKTEYAKIRGCLHPDRVQDPNLKRLYNEAFTLISKGEPLVIKRPERAPKDKPPPGQSQPMPKTADDLIAHKAAMDAARKAQRAKAKADKASRDAKRAEVAG